MNSCSLPYSFCVVQTFPSLCNVCRLHLQCTLPCIQMYILTSCRLYYVCVGHVDGAQDINPSISSDYKMSKYHIFMHLAKRCFLHTHTHTVTTECHIHTNSAWMQSKEETSSIALHSTFTAWITEHRIGDRDAHINRHFTFHSCKKQKWTRWYNDNCWSYTIFHVCALLCARTFHCLELTTP